ncbi:unnamed protein product [Ectocarpus sp. 4 AP-2014]
MPVSTRTLVSQNEHSHPNGNTSSVYYPPPSPPNLKNKKPNIPPSAESTLFAPPSLRRFLERRKLKRTEARGGRGGHTHIVDRRQHEWHSKTCATPVCAPPSHAPSPILPADQQSKAVKFWF